MTDIVIGVVFVLIILAVSLILPLVLIIRWRSHPYIAFFTAVLICCLTMVIIILGLELILDANDGLLLEMGVVASLIGFVFGAPILLIVQWVRRRKKSNLAQKVIEDTF